MRLLVTALPSIKKNTLLVYKNRFTMRVNQCLSHFGIKCAEWSLDCRFLAFVLSMCNF